MKNEKILIVADIHGNGPALGAVLGAESGVTRILCLGDLVNYGPDPAECVRWARSALGEQDLVAGNHDCMAVSPFEATPAKFPGVSEEVLHHTRARLAQGDREFLRNLPSSRNLTIGGNHWLLTHAIPSDPVWGLLHPEARAQRWALEIALGGFPEVLLVGHTHRPFLLNRGNATIVNPGSVGRPKDGDPRASYAIYENGRFDLRRVEYNISETTARLRRQFSGTLYQELAGFLQRGGREPLERDLAA